ncbi:MAG: hypothetical protein A3I66_09625 [Burkholderiales bacterium RIFCSPLOWO2_02_FULL_57_36]|nr:MAG: hypothetical protein A3I66_09625 [Burkholderiales bacterium RIFCSPLOWO2_02_FULL_57_36]
MGDTGAFYVHELMPDLNTPRKGDISVFFWQVQSSQVQKAAAAMKHRSCQCRAKPYSTGNNFYRYQVTWRNSIAAE